MSVPGSSPDTDGRCFVHCSDVCEDLKPFTEKRWNTFLSSVKIWKDLVGCQADIARDFVQEFGSDALASDADGDGLPIPEHGGFHPTCYRYFTDLSKQKRGKLNKEKQQRNIGPCQTGKPCIQSEPSTSSPGGQAAGLCASAKRHLRSSDTSFAGVPKQPSVSAHILPKICIICRQNKTFKDSDGRKRKEPLMLCEQPDGGKLATAAKDKEDEYILLQIQDRDCVAIEVRYHRSCLRNYTVYQSRKSVLSQPIKEKYGKAFATFCSNVIDERIIKHKEIYRTSSLRRLFVKAVRDIECQDATGYKTFSLKQRIKRRYPQLCFLQPHRSYTSEIVYVESLSTEDLVPGAVGSETDTTTTTTDTDTFSSTDTDTTDDERVELLKKPTKGRSKSLIPIASLRDRYATAQDLKDDIMQTRTNLPWPPTSSDLTLESARANVSSKLYNFLAWVVGASDDPENKEIVKIGEAEDRRILTICQDIIYLATKGRQMMPKHASLSMAMRHLTGSSELVGLLNGFGYCASQTTVLEHDTALALQEIEKGPSNLPSNLEKSSYTTLVWDNNDFGERTLSGKGTTHNTNGIAVQHDNVAGVVPQALPAQNRKKTRQRSLPAPATALVRFTGQKKSSPEAFDDSVPLKMSQYNDVLCPYKEKDAAFYVAKSSQERLLPSWTGFNQLLSSNILPKATIAYLPVIDASPTDFNTVHTVLHRSLEIAHQLELPAIVIVVDQAIYCKAQTIRWQEPTFLQKKVIRLGAFHTTMAALACIGKRFQEAGLQDILIEAGVVATGSVAGVMNGHNYNRSIRCHKIMAEALHCLRWQSFMCTLEEERQHRYREEVSSLQGSFPSEFTNHIQGEVYQAMVKEYDNFIEEGKKDATFNFWSSYLEMVENVLLFIRATREGDWQLHLASVRALLPWMFAYDRTNYARYLPVYWMEMSQLPTTYPYIYEELMKGHFGVQRQDSHGFAQVACDMSIEQTVNRDTKTRGGVKGFSTKDLQTVGSEATMKEHSSQDNVKKWLEKARSLQKEKT
ncbi:LOW QUALITY PROTEIN: uncharacterized protein [Diadema setosum]|uniref:LOW QUALITY PROTEIN: uncharacterized protein n=1 Tax=Diadema setosum TaxID=31175 RepID=UPI003B3B9D2B